jgi:parvulin-like peptidyl-prolyl isomerase
VRTIAKLAVAVVIAAPNWSAAINDADITQWRRASGGEAKALTFLIEAAWSEGEARERGISVSDEEAREAIDEKPHDGLKRSDLVYEARTKLLAARIRDQIAQPAAQSVTPEQIDAYVRTYPRMEPERRRARLVIAPSRAKAKAALRALENNVAWRSAARRFGGSGAPRTLEPGVLPDHVEHAVFNAAPNALTRYGTYVFKVIEIIPGGSTPLDQQRATAWEILSSEAQASAITDFKAEFRARWRLRTTCARAYETHPDCGNPPTVE